jgi:predicted PurR-regulated permease PerM
MKYHRPNRTSAQILNTTATLAAGFGLVSLISLFLMDTSAGLSLGLLAFFGALIGIGLGWRLIR